MGSDERSSGPEASRPVAATVMVRAMNTFALTLRIVLTIPITFADFLTANNNVDITECSGTLKAYQSETGVEHRFRESAENTRSCQFVRRHKIKLWAEGNCCWNIYSRKKFKGATLELSQSDGELEVRGGRVKSIRLVDCYTYRRAGGSLSGLLAGLALAILVSVGLILHRRFKIYRPVAATTELTPET